MGVHDLSLRIAVITEFHRLSPRLENEVDTLSKVGHDLKVFYWVRVNQQRMRSGFIDRLNTKIEHEYIFLRAPRGTFPLIFFVPLLYFKFWLRLRRQRFDVVHFTHLLFLPFAVVWGRIHMTKLVYDAYEFHVADCARKASCRLMKLQKLLEVVENWLVSHVDAVLTVDSVGNALFHRYRKFNKNLQVLYNVPRMDAEAKGDPQDLQKVLPFRNQKLIYIGGLSQVKGVMRSVEAIKYVKDEISQVKLILIGSFLDDSEEICNGYIKQQGLEGNVEFLDWMPYNELLRYLKCANVGLALHQPIHRYWLVSRGNGRKFFSYMQASLPIVGPEFGEVGQVVRDEKCGILCDTTDPRKVANAIIYLLKHPQEAKSMGNRGRRAIELKYNWDIEKDKLLKVYHKLEVGGR